MMDKSIKNKILPLDELIQKVNGLRRTGRKVVQSHGIFDLIHPGIIKHLNSAREQGDVLIVTIIKDKDVRKGAGRPIFSETLRAENVASLGQVDYVCLVDDDVPFGCIRQIKPDIFAKGQLYRERDQTIHKKIFEEEKEFYLGRSKIYETGGFSFSSSEIINNFLDIYPLKTKAFLKKFADRYGFRDIARALDGLSGLKALIIGDGIIDEYHYCASMGRSAKAPLVVNKYLNHEVFEGGSFAIANHIAGLCKNVKLVTLLGKIDSREEFILNNLKSNVDTKFFYRDGGRTIVKKRYINEYLNQKLFEINYLTDDYINKECESEIIDYLKPELPKYDLVLVPDFGHGFITDKVIRTIEKYSKRLAVNTQSNAANAGYNMITRYRRPNYVCLDESEVRWATQERFSDIKTVIKKLSKILNTDYLVVTLGKRGSIGINRNKEVNMTPIFSSKVIDTVGAGDAFFAFTAPCLAKNMPLELVSFIGNAVGALAVQIVCNKKSVEKHELLEFVHTLLK